LATVDFSLDELQDGVREIVREEISPIRTELNELRGELYDGLSAVRMELHDGLSEVRGEIRDVKTMLAEDYEAEVPRLDSTNKRLLRLRREFDAHVAGTSVKTVS